LDAWRNQKKVEEQLNKEAATVSAADFESRRQVT